MTYKQHEARRATELAQLKGKYEKAMYLIVRQEKITSVKAKVEKDHTLTLEVYRNHEKHNYDLFSEFKLNNLGFL